MDLTIYIQQNMCTYTIKYVHGKNKKEALILTAEKGIWEDFEGEKAKEKQCN